MKTLLAAALFSFGAVAAAQTPNVYVQDHPLAPGGTVVLTMNVGDVKILPTSGADGVRLEIHTTRSVDQQTIASWVRRFEVAADRATLELQIPKDREHCVDCSGGVDVVLYVPERTDLKADLDVGDLTIRGVEGNKDVHTGVGDVRIAVAHPAEYGHVETHTRIGDINDFLNQGSGDSGFLGHSEDFTLSGRYHLRASTGIGDVHISQEGKS
ncbi:MAG: hypothetical protein WBW84_17110 [Acidobacteriaceae bacterium]